jgi:hypothetical protein
MRQLVGVGRFVKEMSLEHFCRAGSIPENFSVYLALRF